MRNTLCILSLVLFGLFSAQSAIAKPTVDVRGLRLVSKGYEGDQMMRPFNWFPGTSVSLLVTEPEGGIIDVDHDKSTLETFVDDTGKDLLTAPKLSDFGNAGFDMSVNVSGDTKAAALEAKVPTLPDEKAKEITLSGELYVRVATKTTKDTAKNVKVAIGTPVKVGPYTFEISKMGKPEWGGSDKQFAVTLQTNQELEDVKEISFQDATGMRIETSPGSSSRMGFGGQVTVHKEYYFPTQVDSINVVVERWTDMSESKVPFKITTSIGLGSPQS